MIAIKIFLCMFAVWGIYCAIIELCAFLCRKARIICAVRASTPTLEADISRAAALNMRARLPECEPVVICECESEAERARDTGCALYIRYK